MKLEPPETSCLPPPALLSSSRPPSSSAERGPTAKFRAGGGPGLPAPHGPPAAVAPLATLPAETSADFPAPKDPSLPLSAPPSPAGAFKAPAPSRTNPAAAAADPEAVTGCSCGLTDGDEEAEDGDWRRNIKSPLALRTSGVVSSIILRFSGSPAAQAAERSAAFSRWKLLISARPVRPKRTERSGAEEQESGLRVTLVLSFPSNASTQTSPQEVDTSFLRQLLRRPFDGIPTVLLTPLFKKSG